MCILLDQCATCEISNISERLEMPPASISSALFCQYGIDIGNVLIDVHNRAAV